ncbi:ATP-binding protein [Virgibacillus ainsalahensis]
MSFLRNEGIPIKVLHATIYGFGKWVDYEIDLSGDSAIVIYGENESGKSTLQRFILFMLFGLPPKQRDFHRPKTSGKMGGRLTVEDPKAGRYTIVRFDEVRNGAALCYTTDGQVHDEEWLKDRLKGMTFKTYQSIFSFSALDLNALRDMKADDLGEVLLGIGLTGSNNIYTIEKQLDHKIGELFKPYGKKPAINQQLESLNETFGNLRNYKAVEGTYREKKERMGQLTEKLNTLKAELNDEKSRLSSIEKQQHVQPVLHDYHHYTDQLKAYPASLPFPEEGLERLEKLKEITLPLQSELAVREDNQKMYESNLEKLKEERMETASYEKLKDILGRKQWALENKKEMMRIQAAINKISIQIETETAEMNVGISPSDVTSMEIPFHVEKTWNQMKKDMDQLQLEKEQLQQEQNQIKQQRNYLNNQKQETEDGLLSEVHYRKLNEELSEHKEHALLQKLSNDKVRKQDKWQKNKINKEKNSNTILIGLMVFSIITAVVAVFSDLSQLFILTAFLLMIGIGQWFWVKKNMKDMEELLAEEEVAPASLQITDQQREEAQRQLEIHHQMLTEITSIKEQLKATDIQFIQLDEKRKMMTKKESRLDAQIITQYETYPFLEHVEIAYWPELFHRLKQLLRLENERQQFRKELSVLEENQDKFQQEITVFIQEKNGKEDANTTFPLDKQMDTLEHLLEAQQKTAREMEYYEDLMVENNERIQGIIQQLQTYEKEIGKLFKLAEVDTENAYYTKAKQLKEKQNITTARNKAIQQLRVSFPQNTWLQLVESNPNHEQLEMTHKACQDTIKQLEQSMETVQQQLAEVNADLSRMESSETYSRTMHRFEMEQEELNKLSHKWAVLKTAKEMLAETKRNYRDKYLNKVMETTSRYFEKITGSYYKQVYPPANGRAFQVMTSDGIRYNVKELSQGTMDQLYISLRLSISEIMSEEHRLPFIMDDAFVNFDAIRTKRMLEIIEDISTKQQVIIFTCKKEVAESAAFTIRIN